MSEEHKSFREGSGKAAGFGDVTKKEWWSYKKVTTKEYGNAAVLLILGGFLIPFLFPIGMIVGIIWLYQTITTRNKQKL